MSKEMIIAICELLLLAGSITTTMLVNHAIYRFAKQPEIFAELSEDPSLIPGALEEVVRYAFSIANVARLVKQKTTLRGQELNEGEVVLAWMGAANFDETRFPDARRFDLRRSPNPHLSFGYGVHFCLGAPLARLEGRIALEGVVARLRNLRFDPERPVEYLDPRIEMIGRLPIRFG